MSIRLYLALLILLSVAGSLVLSTYLVTWLAAHAHDVPTSLLLPLLPGDSTFLLAFLLVSVLVAPIFFFIVDWFFVRPIRRICEAMLLFNREERRVKLSRFWGSPNEIRTFARTWSSFADKVEDVHARDTQMSRMKTDFISTAAHQLRTPLTGIRWALEALAKEPLTDSQRALTQSAVEKSHDLVTIVGTLLDISSIESGKNTYHFQQGNIARLALDTVADFSQAAERAGITLLANISGDLPTVSMDSDRMKWVLNNLVENAITYTPKDGSVTVTGVRVANRVIIQIIDTGIGIEGADRTNIFERFYRGANAVSKNNQGNGLGLYIARTIVEAHRGELSFEPNQSGLGTTFTLALPASTE